MGSGNVDYSNQVNSALQQANLPKSPLANQYSNMFGSVAPDLMRSLMNVQGLGNAFINSNGAASNYRPPTVNPGQPTYTGQSGGGQTPGGVISNAWDNVFAQGRGNLIPNNNQGFGTGVFSGNQTGQGSLFNQAGQLGWPDGTPSQYSMGPGEGPNATGQQFLNNQYNQWMQQYNQSPVSNGYMGANGQYIPGPGVSMGQAFPNGQFSPSGYAQGMFNATGAGPSSITQNWMNPGGASGTITNNMTGYTGNRDILNQIQNGGGSSIDPFGGGGTGGGFGYGTGGTTGGVGGQFGSVSVGDNGLPNGVNIPGLMQAYGGNPQQQMQMLLQSLGGAQGDVNSLRGMGNPLALQAAGNMGGFGLNNSNVNPQISQLLSGIGGQAPNVQNPNFQQQMLNPQQIGGGFSPTSANLSGVPNSTQLTPENSQYMNAIQQILGQQFDKNIADTRERSISQGTTRSTGQGYDEAQLRAAQLPQLAAALNNVRQQEVSNQLNQAGLQQQGLLQNAGMMNQYGLGGAELGAQTGLQNVSNQMQAGNLNNLTGLQARGQDVGTALANASNMLQQGGLNSGNLSTLLGSQQGQNQLGLQNFLGTIGALQNQYGLQNQFNQTNIGGQQGLASLLGNIGQSNASQGNAYNLGLGGMNQQAAQQMIQNQLGQLASLFGGGMGMAMSGIPGGSANVNVNPYGQQGSSFGSTVGGIGDFIGGLRNLFGR